MLQQPRAIKRLALPSLRFYSTEKDNALPDESKEPVFIKEEGVITAGPIVSDTCSDTCSHDGHEGHVIGNINEYRMLTLVFTCNKCQTRSARKFSHNSYTKGIVIIECNGCGANHLIADNLGWFNKGRNIEEIMLKKGEPVQRLTVNKKEDIPEDDVKYFEEANQRREKFDNRKANQDKNEESK